MHNREAKDATEMLLSECIPSFTYKLDKSFEEAKGIKDFGSFAARFHRAGINMRFLNYVRHYSARPVLRVRHPLPQPMSVGCEVCVCATHAYT